MNYQETLDYLFSQLPMYQRIGKAAYKADLDNTLKLCALLGNPEKKIKSIHVAGTNGKGSTSHLVASVLQEAGYKVGLYTSPHLIDFRERIKINGKMIPESTVVAFIEKHQSDFETIGLSFFEMTVGMAFSYFAKEKVDIAIIETGLGGRLDSTNVITPEISVITNISKDHTQFLGDTLDKIATEKAGIIKKNIPVIIGETQPEIAPIFLAKSKELAAEITFADKRPSFTIGTENFVPYQVKNIQTAVTVLGKLQKKHWKITEENIRNGVQNFTQNTQFFGRWQQLSNNPLTICDTGHNLAGITYIVHRLNEIKYKQLHFVLGTVKDKNIDEILQILPKNATYYFCKANIPRALGEEQLKNNAKKAGLKGSIYSSVYFAIHSALGVCGKNDLLFIGGSTFVVGEALQNFENLFGSTNK